MVNRGYYYILLGCLLLLLAKQLAETLMERFCSVNIGGIIISRAEKKIHCFFCYLFEFIVSSNGISDDDEFSKSISEKF